MAAACLGDHTPFQGKERQEEMGAQLGFSGVAKPQSHALQHRGAICQEGVSLKGDVVVNFSSVLDILNFHLLSSPTP